MGSVGERYPCIWTTHADYFYGAIPCTRSLTQTEIDEGYEYNTGVVITETFVERTIDPESVPAVLCKNHVPFTWGKDPIDAVHNAAYLEIVAKMAALTEKNNPEVEPCSQRILDKHYYRKHGKNAYYGQINQN